MMRKVSVLFAAAALSLSLQSVAWAAVPGVIPFQGRLTNAAGTPINGSQSIVFSLFTVATAGASVWSETQPTVAVANGLFSVDLGSVTAIPTSIFTGGDLFLEIKVGTDAAMTPRQRLGTTAYAFRSGVSSGLAAVSGTVPNIAVGNTGNLLSLTATFPAAGVAYVSASLWYEIGHSAGTDDNYHISINDVGATDDSPSDAYAYISSASSMTLDGTVTTSRAFNVAAGAKTFFLVGVHSFGNFIAARGRLAVMYFPDNVGTISEPQLVPRATAAEAQAEAKR